MIKLYVGNLPYTATEKDLRELFAPYGDVGRVALMTDRISGRSRGFGFVEIGRDGDMNAAVEALSGKDWNGRALKVGEARPMHRPRPRTRGGGGKGKRR